MKVKTSIVTALILRDHCDLSIDLVNQLNKLPPKAENVILLTHEAEMNQAAMELRYFMQSHELFQNTSYLRALKEIEYFGGIK